MKFIPRNSQIIGRMCIEKSSSKIIRPEESKVTKFILVDAVGVDAAAAGIKIGDLIVPTALGNIILNAGTSYRPVVEEKNIAFFVVDVSLTDLQVQTKTGAAFVAFDSPDAAEPLGAQLDEKEKAA